MDKKNSDPNTYNLETYYTDKTDRERDKSERKKLKRSVKIEEIKENKKKQICNNNVIYQEKTITYSPMFSEAKEEGG